VYARRILATTLEAPSVETVDADPLGVVLEHHLAAVPDLTAVR
jgi:hypothetical protein